MKLALVWPDATVTLAGTVTFALLLLSATPKPAPDADWLRVTVQVVVPGVLIVVDEHARPLS